MMGNDDDRGIIHRACDQIFDIIESVSFSDIVRFLSVKKEDENLNATR